MMILDEGVQRPGHDPLRSTTLEVLGWLVGARFAPESCLSVKDLTHTRMT